MTTPSISTSIRAGMIGLLVLGAGITWTGVHFQNADGSAFNPLRNFVSELGSQKLSRASGVFNVCLIVGSLLFFPLVRDLAARLNRKMRRAVLTTGICALIGVIGCGFASMDHLKPHLGAAMLYFWGWLATTLIFTVGLWRKYTFRHAPLLLLAGIASSLLAVIFLAVLLIALIGILNGAFAAPQNFQRPAVWDIAVLEWSVVASFVVWMSAAMAHLHKTRPTPQ
ncbi:MAG: hypothetical protein ABW223_07465 [Rariglobus sp.]